MSSVTVDEGARNGLDGKGLGGEDSAGAGSATALAQSSRISTARGAEGNALGRAR